MLSVFSVMVELNELMEDLKTKNIQNIDPKAVCCCKQDKHVIFLIVVGEMSLKNCLADIL